MALHPDFPQSPYEILHPDVGWFPAARGHVILFTSRITPAATLWTRPLQARAVCSPDSYTTHHESPMS